MFKKSFKYYKSKNPPPSLDEVLDFDKFEELKKKCLIKAYRCNAEDATFCYGLKKPQDWDIFELVSKKGLIFIKNPFTPEGQRYWIRKSLKDYSTKPNKLNIDNFNIVPSNQEWWEVAQTDEKILKSLRWSTLGYHHNWDTKVYSEDNKSDFPEDLKLMTEYIAQKLGFTSFAAEAAIVNYYHLDSTLSGHTDHSEQNLDAPLFSISFGQSAIFLLGGESIDEQPSAIFLQSGDILVMSKESRLCYHGVPRVLKTKHDIWNMQDEVITHQYFVPKDSFWEPFSNYLGNSRININIRQVLNIGQLKLC